MAVEILAFPLRLTDADPVETADYLDALAEPFESVLAPLGFRRVDQNDNLRGLSVDWATDAVIVSASYEPPESWGDVCIGRRRRGDQPYWSLVPLSEILRLRGAGAMRNSRQRRQAFAMPADVRAWALVAAERLSTQTDLLRGQGLEVIDRAISELPRQGMPGLDFPE